MTARNILSPTVALPEAKAPELAGDGMPPHDARLEELLHGQQHVMNLVLKGGSLQEVLDRAVSVIETAFAPAIAAVSLFQRDGRALKRQAAPSLRVELLSSL